MPAPIDYTAIALALVGLATVGVNAWVMLSVKRMELRAAESARRAAGSHAKARAAVKRSRKGKRRRRKPPDYPCS